MMNAIIYVCDYHATKTTSNKLINNAKIACDANKICNDLAPFPSKIICYAQITWVQCKDDM